MCFYHVGCDFQWNIFCHEFSMFGYAHIVFSFIVICTHIRCHTTNVHFILCAYMWKDTILKNSRPKKERWTIFFIVLSIFSFWFKNYFDMCFHNLIKFYASHLYYIIKAIWYQSIYTFLYKQVLSAMGICLSKEK